MHSFLGPLGDFESILLVAAVLSVEPGPIVRCWSEARIQRQELLERLLTICDIPLRSKIMPMSFCAWRFCGFNLRALLSLPNASS